MARRPTLTGAKKLLSEPFGRRPHTVRLREPDRGANVVLDYTTPGGRKWESLGFPVRHQDGRRWTWDDDALEEAREAAEDFAAALRLGQLRQETAPDRLTVGEAFALYHDSDRGGLPSGKGTRLEHAHFRGQWEAWFGAETPWNSVTPADTEAWVQRQQAKGFTTKGWTGVKVLRAVYNWLTERRGIEHLSDPTRGIRKKEVMRGHTPKRPRFSREESERLLKVRHDVDPRFALLVALMDDSGARTKALRLAMRSGLDVPLEPAPTKEQAPHGWLLLPALKEQDAPLVFLTAFQRREVTRALTGYLAELERVYQETGKDFPLFPGVRLDSKGQIVRPEPMQTEDFARYGIESGWKPEQAKAYRPISHARMREFLLEAEKLAKVEHIRGRGYHGIRRAWTDHVYAEKGLAVAAVAGAWSSERTPEKIYLDRSRYRHRAEAREAMDQKRQEEAE